VRLLLAVKKCRMEKKTKKNERDDCKRRRASGIVYWFLSGI